jgi:hypothetical protein
MNDCIIIRKYLQHINKQFFASEEKGFQSWCADMWAVLWNLWLRDIETKNISEMDFSWASDPIEKVHKLGMFHNDGITKRDRSGQRTDGDGNHNHTFSFTTSSAGVGWGFSSQPPYYVLTWIMKL